MKRVLVSLGLVALAITCNGCIAAMTIKENSFGIADREVVAVNDQVYVVDKATGVVMELDLSMAGPFVPREESD